MKGRETDAGGRAGFFPALVSGAAGGVCGTELEEHGSRPRRLRRARVLPPLDGIRVRWRGRPWSRARVRALTAFFGSSGLLGLGFALVDQTQSGSDPLYYYGFAIAFLGIVALFNTAEDAIFRPTWAFGAAFLVEIYGWWNLFWTLVDIPKCGGCNLGSSIILANLGSLFPSDGGLVRVPLGLFAVSTVLAIGVPIALADGIPRDVSGRARPAQKGPAHQDEDPRRRKE